MVLFCACWMGSASAEDKPATAAGLDAPPTAAAPAGTVTNWKPDSGDTAWMLVSTGLVLLMTPGLAFFYAGMVRRKNVLGTMMQSWILMGLVSVEWAMIGYSMAFDKGLPFVGGLSFALLPWDQFKADDPYGYARHDSALRLHVLPDDVRHHHSGPDLRRSGGPHEVQGHGALLAAVGLGRLQSARPHDLGQRRTAARRLGQRRGERGHRALSRPWTSPAARSCTFPRASRRWCAA